LSDQHIALSEAELKRLKFKIADWQGLRSMQICW